LLAIVLIGDRGRPNVEIVSHHAPVQMFAAKLLAFEIDALAPSQQ
jgi:hypothetical protein